MNTLFKGVTLALVLGFLLVIATCPGSYAEGIKVSPGAFCMQNADVDKDTDLGIDLVITNGADEEQVFTIRPVKPSEAKKSWLQGYAEIPDPGWF